MARTGQFKETKVLRPVQWFNILQSNASMHTIRLVIHQNMDCLTHHVFSYTFNDNKAEKSEFLQALRQKHKNTIPDSLDCEIRPTSKAAKTGA